MTRELAFALLALFGHRRDAPTWIERIVHPLAAIPTSIWVAIIGVVAAVLAPIVGHKLAKRRDAFATERATALLRAQVRAHVDALETWRRNRIVDPDLWQTSHEAFARRLDDPIAREASAPAYEAAVRAIHVERAALLAQRREAAGRDAPSLAEFTSENLDGAIASYRAALPERARKRQAIVSRPR